MAEIDSAKFYGTEKVSTTIWGQEFWGSYVEGNPPATLTEDTVMSGLKISGSSFTVGEGAVIGIENGTVLSGHTTASISGVALYAGSKNTTVLIDGSTISDNYTATNELDGREGDGVSGAGGAIFSEGVDSSRNILSVSDTLFYGNTISKVNKSGYGGAITASYTNLTVSGSTFTENVAYGGAAIYVRHGANSFTGNLFSENHGANGALALYNGSTNTVSGNRFFSNDSTNSGGAIYVTCTSANISGSTFYDNVAKGSGGGGMFINGGAVTVTDNFFDKNFANISTGGGGAISVKATKLTVTLSGNTYCNNTTTGNGAAIIARTGNTVNITDELFYKNSASKLGGAVYSDGATLNINGATFGTVSDTLYAAGGVVNFSGNLLVRASLTGDGTAAFNVDGANFVFDNTTAIEVGNMTVTSATMQFTNTQQVDFTTQDLSNAAITVDGSNYLTQGTHTLATGINAIGTYELAGDLAGQTLAFADGSLTLTAEHTYNKAAIVTGDDKTYLVCDGKYYTGNKYDSLAAALANTKEKTIVVTGELNSRQVINTSVNVSISDAKANGNICSDNSGGVLRITDSPVVTLYGGTFSYNQALAQGDVAAAGGGAIHSTGTLTVNKTLFDNNKTAEKSSFYGGAICSRGGTLTINGATFTNNYGFTSGGAVMTNNRTNIYDSYFFNNSSVSYGGALVTYSTTLVSGGTFSGNESTSGAVIFVRGGTNTVTGGALFDRNEANLASGSGGAIWAREATSVVNGATFSNNKASLGGAISVYGSTASKAYISNALFDGNVATSTNSANGGGAIYIANGAGTVTIADSTFATATDTIYNLEALTFSGNVTLNASLYGNGVFTIADGANFTIGQGVDLNGVDFTKATITVDGADYLTDTLIATGVGGADTTKLNVINNKFMALTLDGTELWLKEIAGTAITENIFTGNGLTNMDGGAVGTLFATKGDESEIATKISGGKVESNLVGGAYVAAGNTAAVDKVELLIGGTAEVAAKVYAGGYLYGNNSDSAEAQMEVAEVNVTLDGGKVSTNMFGGAHAREYGNANIETVNITVSDGIHGRIYAGGWAEKGAESRVGTSNVIISGGTVDYLYGAGANADGETYVDTTNITIENDAVVNTIFMGGRYGYSYVNTVNLTFAGENKELTRLSGVSSAGMDYANATVVELATDATADLIDYVDKFVINEDCTLTANNEFYLGNRNNKTGATEDFTTFDFIADGEASWTAVAGISDFTNAKFSVNGAGLTTWDGAAAIEIGGYSLTYDAKDKTIKLAQITA